MILQIQRIILTLVLIIISRYGYSQGTADFVVLREQSDTLKADTIYGTVILPHNGVFWNVKIKTASGVRKFKNKEVTRIKAQNLYFASIPYGKSYAIVPRILDGELELYFYYTGSDRLTFISKMQHDFNRDIEYDNLLFISESIWNATSNFYIFSRNSNQFVKVTRSSDKFKEHISEIFKSNESIYRKIKNGDYKPEQIGQIIKSYNNAFHKL